MPRHAQDPQSKDPTGPSFSLWGVATSLADSVKKNTAEITTGIKETNWRAELEAFSKGVREEEHQLRKETVKRVEVAKEHLPKDVGTAPLYFFGWHSYCSFHCMRCQVSAVKMNRILYPAVAHTVVDGLHAFSLLEPKPSCSS